MTSGHLFGQCCFLFMCTLMPLIKLVVRERVGRKDLGPAEYPTATAHVSCLLSPTTSSEGTKSTACATFFRGGYVVSSHIWAVVLKSTN